MPNTLAAPAQTFAVGDWVQLASIETLAEEAATGLRVRDVGHVVETYRDRSETSGQWFDLLVVYFERWGGHTTVWPEDLIRLGDSETGKHPVPPRSVGLN